MTEIKFTIRQIPYQPGTDQDINQNNLAELKPFCAHMNPQTNTHELSIHKLFNAKLSAYPFIYEPLLAKFQEVTVIDDGKPFPSAPELDDETGYWLVYRSHWIISPPLVGL